MVLMHTRKRNEYLRENFKKGPVKTELSLKSYKTGEAEMEVQGRFIPTEASLHTHGFQIRGVQSSQNKLLTSIYC